MSDFRKLVEEVIKDVSSAGGVSSPRVEFIDECNAYYDDDTVYLPKDIECADYLTGGDADVMSKYLIIAVHETFHHILEKTNKWRDRSILNNPWVEERLSPVCKVILSGEVKWDVPPEELERQQKFCLHEAWANWMTKEFVESMGLKFDVRDIGDIILQFPEINEE